MPAESGLEVAASPVEHYAPSPERFASYPKQEYYAYTPGSYPSKELYANTAYIGSPPPAFPPPPPAAPVNDRTPRKWRERHPLLLAGLSALVAAIVVGGAVGGGLGALIIGGDGSSQDPIQPTSPEQQLHATKTLTLHPSPSASTTTSGLLINYTAATPTSIASLSLNCSALNAQPWTSSTGSAFQIACPQTYGGGDLASLIAYNIYDCMEACSALNLWQGRTGWCERVAFSALIGEDHAPYPRSNCWLKSNESNSAEAGPDTASARLIDS